MFVSPFHFGKWSMRQQGSSHANRRVRGRPGGNQNHRKQQSRNGVFDSNGPGGRLRGNANQLNEKYLQLARDATSAGDRVVAESYYQFAEHYYRIAHDLAESQRQKVQSDPAHAEQPDTATEKPVENATDDKGTESPRDSSRPPRARPARRPRQNKFMSPESTPESTSENAQESTLENASATESPGTAD